MECLITVSNRNRYKFRTNDNTIRNKNLFTMCRNISIFGTYVMVKPVLISKLDFGTKPYQNFAKANTESSRVLEYSG